uniref:Scavenger receptor class F member 2-like isoform X3 n=1 Tax=Crassostrea virginica TaxID=6565 RepID=A0A8B8F239_CRAVI|nr:scavenger receptor class F member 2-like isoform X3 [Crassostrea virginica]
MLLFTLLMFLKNILSIQNQQSGFCSNSTIGKPLECCRNYQLIMNSCTECPPGKHGWNCSDECPPTFYGRLCRERCSCDPCDKVNGCFNISGVEKRKVMQRDLNLKKSRFLGETKQQSRPLFKMDTITYLSMNLDTSP